MKNTKSRTPFLKSTFAALLVICMSVLNLHISPSWAVASAVVKKETTTTSASEATGATEKKADEPEAKKTSTSNGWLYGGIGVAAVVAVAAAAGSGGGSSDTAAETTTTATTTTTTTTTPVKATTPTIVTPADSNPSGTKPVGPAIGGSDWTGYIYVVGAPPASSISYVHQNQSISASIYQNGNYVAITTSSNLAYGRKFVGSISTGGRIVAYDQNTGETWSTNSGAATKKSIDLYDYVDQFHQLDHVHLVR